MLERARVSKGQQSVWEAIHRGSYPELQDRKVVWSEYYSDYVKTYLERDVRALAAVQDFGAFRQFMAATAIRVQEPSGRIATFWTSGGFKDPNGDWINCMAAIARALENLE